MNQNKPLWKKSPEFIRYFCKRCLIKGEKIQFEIISDYHIKTALKLQCPKCHRKSYFLKVIEINI